MSDDPGQHDLTADIEQRVVSGLGRLTDEDAVRLTPPPAILAGIRRELGTSATVTELRPKRWTWLAAAAAVVAAVVGVGVVMSRDGDSEQLVMQAALSNDTLSEAARGAQGNARMHADGSAYSLELSLRNLPTFDNQYLEVWLIDTNVDRMVSLGPYHGDGRYAVPSGYDPNQFPIVDVSIEPPDGEPRHSSVSALRGQLQAAG